jgi:copper transport protein
MGVTMRRVLCALLACLLLAPGLASAHAVLLGSKPEAKASVEASPQAIVLSFNENVGPVFVKVLDATGTEVGAPGEVKLDGNDLRLPLGKALANGTYIVTYRVISADTHPVGGSFVFAVGEPLSSVAAPDASAPAARSAWWIAVALNRFVHYASVLLALGSAIVLVWMRLPEAVAGVAFRQGSISAVVAAVVYLLALAFGGAEMVSGGPGAFVSPGAWAMAAKSTLLPSAVLGVPGALLLAWAMGSRRTGWSLWAGGALVLASFLLTGHAATAAPVWLMATNVAVHLVCAAFWFASLAPLIAAARGTDRAGVVDVLGQFSSRAVWTVAALLLTGLVVSFVQVRSPAQLVASDYGVRLSVKIALFVVLLALAAVNKLRFTPAIVRGEPSGAARLAGSMRAEYGLMLAIVLVAASLTVVTPPRALLAQGAAMGAIQGAAAAAAGAGFRTSVQQGGYTFDVEVTPAKPGENMIMVTFRDGAGKPVNMVSSKIELSLPAAAIENVEVEGQAMPPGMYHFMASQMIVPGEWKMRIEGFVDDFDKVASEVVVPVR